ncbi:MAG TPA: hypothetical protein V6C71_00800 [Coleofasciculaceae cyanobacterium]|jgi:uncharacterized membrane protein HdeD (DUF308 family)
MLQNFKTVNSLKKLKGLVLVGLGFMLSPLSWWNDLFFNLPIAYFFGYICAQFSANLFLPCAIAGYWLSNVLGILLMQLGVLDVVQEQSQERNFQKELLMGLASSTVYTAIILLLLQFNILSTPDLFTQGESLTLKSFVPIN